MINWKYVLPRLLVLAAIGLFLWLGLSPLVHWWIVSFGQAVTGAKVEVESVHASLLTTELRLKQLEVADPRDPRHNLFQAEDVVLDLDTRALLHRKLVVREGRISGLEVGTERATSGSLTSGTRNGPGASLVDWNAAGERMAEFGSRWLEYAADTLGRRVLDESETVRLSRELTRRWPEEYSRLEARADVLRRRADDLKRKVQTPPQGNPLRNIEVFRQAAAEVQAIEQELRTLRDELARLQQQAGQDREALAAAGQRDVQRVRQTLELDGLDAGTLSEYLLGPEQGQRLAEVIAWVEWGRQYVPEHEADDNGPARLRGEEILFRGVRNDPDFLIQSLVLDGRGRLGGETLHFKGTASGLTNDPVAYGKPAMLRLQTSGAAQLLVEAMLDRTGELPHDRFTMTCPAIHKPGRTLGNPEQLALSVSPGKIQMTAFVDVKGGYLSGQLMLRESNVRLTPSLGDKYGGERLASQLGEALAQVDTVEVAIDLSGTLREPNWKLRSNLGPQLADAVSGAFQRELDARMRQLAAEVQTRADQELAQFEQVLLARQRSVLEKLQLSDSEISQLGRLVSAQMGVPERFRQGNLPLDDLFRRQ
jgi:uncharacterized protein (TIGR03545 family)